jgi:hypothetical protein
VRSCVGDGQGAQAEVGVARARTGRSGAAAGCWDRGCACREHQHRRATLFCPTASPLGPTMPCSQALKLQSRAPMAPSASSLASLFFSETARRHRPDTRLGFFLGKRKIMHTAHLARGPWSLAGPVWNLMKLVPSGSCLANFHLCFYRVARGGHRDRTFHLTCSSSLHVRSR